MKGKRAFGAVCLAICCIISLAGCGNSQAVPPADMDCTQTELETMSLPATARVVGLGEASHGVKEYHQMKAQVFKNLVANNGCRTFVIEGDFGGALKVDAYIHGGAGTAEEAVGEIGFAIYRTREMADLVEWMRSYNGQVPQEDSLHFCGMDVQRFDNNKAYLFSILDESAPELSTKYREAFSMLTDKDRTSLDKTTLENGRASALELLTEMDGIEADIASTSGQAAFDVARECVNTIYACCDLLLSGSYNETRDQYMLQKVEWFMEHGDGSVLFINGHNGHIGKTSVAGYTCLGERLAGKLGDAYYAIGTDARETKFNSQKDAGGFEVVEVSNVNDLNGQFENAGGDRFFVDVSEAASDETWRQILDKPQVMTTLNVGLSGLQRWIKFGYTTTIVPSAAYDGMIVFQKVSPTTLLE